MAPDAKPAKASKTSKADKSDKEDKSKVHKLALKGSAKLVAEFVSLSFRPLWFSNTRYTPSSSNEASTQQKTSQRTSIIGFLSLPRQMKTNHTLRSVKKYGLNML
ncbi:HORMA domain-containing protein, partial [Colletotrichum salicis]